MGDGPVTEADLAELVDVVAQATAAYISGEIRRYVALIEHADDYTLMPPYGGETIRGFDPSEEHIAELERTFTGGEAALELIESYASGNLAVLVAVERQHGTVHGNPDQDCSLRVTLVFRREGSRWLLVHRHADPLVHPITFDHLARLARGDP